MPSGAFARLTPAILELIRPPVLIIGSSISGTAQLAADIGTSDTICFQFDIHQAEHLRQSLLEHGTSAEVVTAPDIWDLPLRFSSVLYLSPEKGERNLKLDIIEQVYHVLAPRGKLVVLSRYDADEFFPKALKKIYRRVHAPLTDDGQVFWCQHDGDRARRRHEVTFQVRGPHGQSLRFLSRPGVFSFGRFDDGARALVETMHIEPGDHVLDVGCGCGTNGVWAGLLSGPQGKVTFVDSNVRALALADINAYTNGIASHQQFASSNVTGIAEQSVDVALANPPYFAQSSIARLFAERSRQLLRPGGRFYLVTRQPDQVGPMVAELFGDTQVFQRRGYIVLAAQTPMPSETAQV